MSHCGSNSLVQVRLVLVSELRPADATERGELVDALSRAVCELDLEREAAQEVAGQRTPQHEVRAARFRP